MRDDIVKSKTKNLYVINIGSIFQFSKTFQFGTTTLEKAAVFLEKGTMIKLVDYDDSRLYFLRLTDSFCDRISIEKDLFCFAVTKHPDLFC